MIKNSIQSKKATKKISAGILMYNINDVININNGIKFLLVHPGGPFWKNKNEGAWTIPKGEVDEENIVNNSLIETAIREMKEETGIEIPLNEPLIELGFIKQKAGKLVYAWAYKGEINDGINCTSLVELEYPNKSGKIIKFPEVDKGAMFTKEEAKKLINPAQFEFIEKLENILINSNHE